MSSNQLGSGAYLLIWNMAIYNLARTREKKPLFYVRQAVQVDRNNMHPSELLMRYFKMKQGLRQFLGTGAFMNTISRAAGCTWWSATWLFWCQVDWWSKIVAPVCKSKGLREKLRDENFDNVGACGLQSTIYARDLRPLFLRQMRWPFTSLYSRL